MVILGKRAISYELIPVDVRKRGGIPVAVAALGNVRRKVFRGRAARPTPESRPVMDALSRDGTCVLRLGTDAFAAIAAEATLILEGLRRARGERKAGGRDFAESRASALRSTNQGLFRAVDSRKSPWYFTPNHGPQIEVGRTIVHWISGGAARMIRSASTLLAP